MKRERDGGAMVARLECECALGSLGLLGYRLPKLERARSQVMSLACWSWAPKVGEGLFVFLLRKQYNITVFYHRNMVTHLYGWKW